MFEINGFIYFSIKRKSTLRMKKLKKREEEKRKCIRGHHHPLPKYSLLEHLDEGLILECFPGEHHRLKTTV